MRLLNGVALSGIVFSIAALRRVAMKGVALHSSLAEKKMVKKRYYGNKNLGLAWDCIKLL